VRRDLPIVIALTPQLLADVLGLYDRLDGRDNNLDRAHWILGTLTNQPENPPSPVFPCPACGADNPTDCLASRTDDDLAFPSHTRFTSTKIKEP